MRVQSRRRSASLWEFKGNLTLLIASQNPPLPAQFLGPGPRLDEGQAKRVEAVDTEDDLGSVHVGKGHSALPSGAGGAALWRRDHQAHAPRCRMRIRYEKVDGGDGTLQGMASFASFGAQGSGRAKNSLHDRA